MKKKLLSFIAAAAVLAGTAQPAHAFWPFGSGNKAPTVQLTSLAVDAGVVKAKWSGSDPEGDAIQYSYRLRNGILGFLFADWSAWTTNTSASFGGVKDGSYTFEVKAKDAKGNTSSAASKDVKVTLPKNRAPTISITAATASPGRIEAKWAGKDPDGDSLSYRHRLKSGLLGFLADWSSWGHEASKVFRDLKAGDYTLEVQARDPQGASASASRDAKVPAARPPVVTEVRIADKETPGTVAKELIPGTTARITVTVSNPGPEGDVTVRLRVGRDRKEANVLDRSEKRKLKAGEQLVLAWDLVLADKGVYYVNASTSGPEGAHEPGWDWSVKVDTSLVVSTLARWCSDLIEGAVTKGTGSRDVTSELSPVLLVAVEKAYGQDFSKVRFYEGKGIVSALETINKKLALFGIKGLTNIGGFTMGDRVFLPDVSPLSGSNEFDNKWDMETVAHELHHVTQYRAKDGIAGFLVPYFTELIKVGYADISFEKEAYKVGRKFADDHFGKLSLELSGGFQYEDRPFDADGFTGKQAWLPARYAKLEVLGGDGRTIYTGWTGSDGTFRVFVRDLSSDRWAWRISAETETVTVLDSRQVVHRLEGPWKPLDSLSVDVGSVKIDRLKNPRLAPALNIMDVSQSGRQYTDKAIRSHGFNLRRSVGYLKCLWDLGVDVGSTATSYSPWSKTMNIRGAAGHHDEYDDAPILHEFGHHLENSLSLSTSPGGGHSFYEATGSDSLAWSEGWATYFSCLARGTSAYIHTGGGSVNFMNDIESPDLARARGTDVESASACLLWDLHDGANEKLDAHAGNTARIWTVMNMDMDHRVELTDSGTIQAFIRAWRNRGKEVAAEDLFKTYGHVAATPAPKPVPAPTPVPAPVPAPVPPKPVPPKLVPVVPTPPVVVVPQPLPVPTPTPTPITTPQPPVVVIPQPVPAPIPIPTPPVEPPVVGQPPGVNPPEAPPPVAPPPGNPPAPPVAPVIPDPDQGPPWVAITEPAVPSVVVTDAGYVLQGAADDPGSTATGVSRVDVKLGDGDWQAASGIRTWSVALALSAGDNAVSARAVDAAGNVSATIERTITLRVQDGAPPVLAIVEPAADGSRVSASTVRLQGTASDPGAQASGLAAVEGRVDQGPWRSALGLASWSIELPLIPGANRVEMRARDQAGNSGASVQRDIEYLPVVLDRTPPRITSGPDVVAIASDGITVRWETDELSHGALAWGSSMAYGAITQSPGPARSHELSVSGIAPQVTLHFQARATDLAGNGPTLSADGEATTRPHPDRAPPVFTSRPAVVQATETSITIEWTTDEPARGYVEYSVNGGPMARIDRPTPALRHVVQLAGLSPGAAVSGEVAVHDAAGNGPGRSRFQGSARPAPDAVAPVVTGGPELIPLGPDRVLVRWATDELTTGAVDYGPGPAYGFRVYSAAPGVRHEVELTGLAPGAALHLRVEIFDSSGNGPVRTADSAFATPAAPDRTPPVILAGPVLAWASDTLAIIEWTTDEPSDTRLEHSQGASAPQTTTIREWASSHRAALAGLAPGADIELRAGSRDASGNGPVWSAPLRFRTLAAPDLRPPAFVSGPDVLAVTETSAEIAWSTDEAASGRVEFGETPAYGEFRVTAREQREQRVLLSGLKPGTRYHFAVRASDLAGNGPAGSQDSSFMTPLGGLQVLGGALPDAKVGRPYAWRLQAWGGSGRYTWSLVGGAPPAGMRFGADGVIDGTPAASGAAQLVVKVSDAANPGYEAERRFVLLVASGAPGSLAAPSTTAAPKLVARKGDGCQNLGALFFALLAGLVGGYAMGRGSASKNPQGPARAAATMEGTLEAEESRAAAGNRVTWAEDYGDNLADDEEAADEKTDPLRGSGEYRGRSGEE